MPFLGEQGPATMARVGLPDLAGMDSGGDVGDSDLGHSLNNSPFSDNLIQPPLYHHARQQQHQHSEELSAVTPVLSILSSLNLTTPGGGGTGGSADSATMPCEGSILCSPDYILQVRDSPVTDCP